MSSRSEIEKIGIENTAGYKNLIAIRDYAVKNRALIRSLEAKVEKLEQMSLDKDNRIKVLNQRLAYLQGQNV